MSTNSGTSAIHCAYVAIGLQPGDEVLAAAYSFHSSLTPLLHIGTIPVLCESDPLTGNLDSADAEKRIAPRTRAITVTHIYTHCDWRSSLNCCPRTRAITVTHIYGYPADMDSIVSLARRCKLRVIEDCSHAHGARIILPAHLERAGMVSLLLKPFSEFRHERDKHILFRCKPPW